ncbi:SusC/RagA family TonB-linked outer membrane protein [Parachryseolinea silvisoli]|uniref:SusC/RagA family TonB-linked outer membrane protein n=1 Tax=Parachryseolinea silvisoli TaxID=2873601 RepID=UPI002265BFA1|nr:SusC/RagA family TonB-linked outer membrane protein [Parachryseolinea silvisoli]MCD9018891.1 SusC/RagA family TonB-linked outer membrane protein [Parachryseolinea silvisoli]
MRNFTRTWEDGIRLVNAFARIPHLRKIMRVSTACLMLIVTLALHLLKAESVHSQTIENTYVSIEAQHISLRLIFAQIERQTSFLFVFSPDVVDRFNDISISPGTKSVREVLDVAIGESDLGYLRSNRTISVFKLKGKSNKGISTVTGVVKDILGNPMAGVNVVIRGTTNGTTTDVDGIYTIDAGSNDWLIFSFIGYKTVEILIGNRTTIDQILEEDARTLDMVEVGGYYKTQERTTTSNIVKILSKDIERQPVTSPLLSLQGRVAGLEVNPQNGAPGAAPRIRIRGENSLRSDGGYPLYVIDGVIVDSSPLQSQSGLYAMGIDPLSNLNPDNIESIEVLKDADATAIYGSRGANGVILVTTKKGRSSDHLSVDIGAYGGVGRISNKVDLLNHQQYLEMRREAFRNANATPGQFDYDMTQWDTTRYTDWQDELLSGSAKISDFQGSISSGLGGIASFRIGGAYHDETSFMSDDLRFSRASASFNFNYRPTEGRLSVDFAVNYGVNNNTIANLSRIVESALSLSPVAPRLYNDDGSLNWEIIDYGTFKLASFTNPMVELLKVNESKLSTLVANANLKYRIVNGLDLSASLGYTDTNGDEIIRTPIVTIPPINRGANSTGSAMFSDNRRTSWIIEPQLNYSKRLGYHSFDALVGGTFQGNDTRWVAVNATGYASDVLLNTLRGARSYTYSADDNNQYRYMASFARLGYNYDDKYFVNFTGRRDGSSRFGPGNQFGNFGAVGAAWIFSNESFLRDKLKFLSLGKLRISYGKTGNDQIGDYQYYNLFRIGDSRYQNSTTLTPNGLFNRDFKWEVTAKLESSLEIRLLDDRFSVLATYYKNRSSNQLVNYQLPTTTGFDFILTNFNATVENRGLEFVLQSQNIRSKRFDWTTSINLTVPKNELISFPGIEDSPYSKTYKVGEPLAIQYQYVWSGVNPQTGQHVIDDLSGDGAINYVDDGRFGSALVDKYYGGVVNTIRYGQFELSLLFQYCKRNGTSIYNDYPGMFIGNQPIEVMNRWENDGDITDIAKFSTDFTLYNEYTQVRSSNYNTVDASFIRLKTMSVTYKLPSTLLDKLNMKQLNVFVQGQNLWTITNFIGLDPETGARSLPQLRMITYGLQASF